MGKCAGSACHGQIINAVGIVRERKWESDAAARRHSDGDSDAQGTVRGIHGFIDSAEIVVASTGNGRGSSASDGRELRPSDRAECDEGNAGRGKAERESE